MKYKSIFIASLFCLACCSNYAGKSKSELLCFEAKNMIFDSIYTVPYSGNKIELIVKPRFGIRTLFYKAKEPLADSFFIKLHEMKYYESQTYLKIKKIKFKRSISEDGYMKLSEIKMSFLDTTIISIDSIRKDKKEIDGILYLSINKNGETDLKTETYDTLYYVHFKVDSSLIKISNNGTSKRWNENAFLMFTWPLK